MVNRRLDVVKKDEQGRWCYGDAGDRYPVVVGDIWQVGPHLLACGDLECGAARELLSLASSPPDVMLTDPPWNAGNARAFRTKAGVSHKVDFQELMQHVLDASKCVGGGCYLEMGIANTLPLVRQIHEQGGLVLHIWPMTYYGKFSCRMLHFSWSQATSREEALSTWEKGLLSEGTPPASLDETEISTYVLQQSPGKLILDPCIGRGLTARIAHQQHKQVIGLELHPRRLAVTIDWLVGQGLTAQKCGELHTMKSY